MDAMAKKLLRYCAFLATVGLLTLAACSSKPGLRAPVEDRGRVATQISTPTPEVSAAPANGPAVVVDQLTVLVWDAYANGNGNGIPAMLTTARRELG
jgi:hypothetical protein